MIHGLTSLYFSFRKEGWNYSTVQQSCECCTSTIERVVLERYMDSRHCIILFVRRVGIIVQYHSLASAVLPGSTIMGVVLE